MAWFAIAPEVHASPYYLPTSETAFGHCSRTGSSIICPGNLIFDQQVEVLLDPAVPKPLSLTIGGDLTFGNGFELNAPGLPDDLDITIRGNLNPGNNAILNGNVTVRGSVNAPNNAEWGGSLTIAGNLNLGNNSTIEGSIHVDGAVDVGNGNIIVGDIYASTVVIDNNNIVVGNVTAEHHVNIGHNSTITGNVTAPVINNNGTIEGDRYCNTYNGQADGCVQEPAPVIDHLRVLHDGAGLTCAPASVTLIACRNAGSASGCEPYLGEAAVEFAVAGRARTVTFSGGTAELSLRHTAPGTATLSAAAVSPAAANPTRCFGSEAETCQLHFTEAGFLFDVPTLIANRPSGPVSVRAVKADPDDPQSCAPAFSGPRQVRFWSSYQAPATGFEPVRVNDGPVPNAAPGEPLSLSFNADAEATIVVRYNDAGRLGLHAVYEGAAGGEEAGLRMTGHSVFVAKPAGLCVQAPAECVAGDHSCPPFRAAGEEFDLIVRGVVWESDGDQDLCRLSDGTPQPATPNFRLEGIRLGATLVAPAGGAPAILGQAQLDLEAGDGGGRIVPQTVSEVGVFRFSAQPMAGSYHGEDVAGGVSRAAGRFVPAQLTLTLTGDEPGVLANACGDFTYIGQRDTADPTRGALRYLGGGAPGLLVRAQNVAGDATRNYTGAFARLTAAALFERLSAPTADNEQAGVNGAALPVAATLHEGSLTDHGNGTLTYRASSEDHFVYLRDDNARVPPFVAQLALPLDAVVDADGVAAQAQPAALPVGGASLRYGRGYARDTHGTQGKVGDRLTVPVGASYFSASGWRDSDTDECSAFGYSRSDQGAGFATVVEPASRVSLLAGRGDLDVVVASGNGRGGRTVLELDWPLWLPGPARATAVFGVYRGDDRFLYWIKDYD